MVGRHQAEFADPKGRASRTVVVDKHRQTFDASVASALLGRAVPKDSGLYLATPSKRETLTSNLLRVEALDGIAMATYVTRLPMQHASPRGRGWANER
jgi:hypothetical protein